MPFGIPGLALAWVGSLVAPFLVPDAAEAPLGTASAAAPMTGSIRALEGGAESTTGALQEINRTKRLTWGAGPSYIGVALDEVVATFRIEGSPASRIAAVAVFEKLASMNESLLRPPMVAISTRGVEYRGVVENLSYECNGQRCDVKIALLQTPSASVRMSDEGWEWGPRY